jgi:hypothetical protein
VSSCNGAVIVPATHAVQRNISVGAADQAQPSADPNGSTKVVHETQTQQACTTHGTVVRCFVCNTHIKNIGMCVQGRVVCCPCYENKIVPRSLITPSTPTHSLDHSHSHHDNTPAHVRAHANTRNFFPATLTQKTRQASQEAKDGQDSSRITWRPPLVNRRAEASAHI